MKYIKKIDTKRQKSFVHVLILLCILAVFPITSDAQNQKVNLSGSNITLRMAFEQIEKQTNMSIDYDAKTIDTKKAVITIQKSTTLSGVLTQILQGTGYTYLINGSHIIISNNGNDVNKTKQVKSKQVSGVVRDEKGETLIGVNVMETGTKNGTITDVNGNFSIEVHGVNSVLKFSYIGYNPKKVEVNDQTSLSIKMSADEKNLDEVVVTALGIKKEAKSLSYNVQQISGNDVNKVPDASFVNNLNGKIAGVTINSSSSGVGGSSRVIMRGIKSISGNNNAMYVIDGIPMSNITTDQPQGIFDGAGQTGDGVSNLNPDDIESISVLSGPSAAALYGSNAANGVVMITTRKGQKERMSISVVNSTMFSSPLILPKFQTTYGQSESGSYDSWGDKLTTPSTYNPANFFQTGATMTNSISLSTGTDKNQTYASLGSVNSQGIIHNNDYNRYNFSVRNTSTFFNDKMTMDLGFMASNVKEQNMISQGLYFNPLVPIYIFPAGDDFSKVQIYKRYNASRNLQTQFWPYSDQGLAMQNPYWVTEQDKFVNYKDRYMTNASLKYEFDKGINLSGHVKMDKNNERHEKRFNASTSTLFASESGYYSLNEIESRQIYADALLSVNKYFLDKKFGLIANIGSSFENNLYNQDMFGGKLYGVANLFTYSNVNPTTAESSQSGYTKEKQSVFFSAQIGYKSMVYLDVTARNDWASTFANSKTNSFFYPSVGLSGIVTDMFNCGTDIMPYMKVRISYSEVGNEAPLFATIPTYKLASGYPETQTRMPNSDLKPERTKALEGGLNFVFFKNKVKLDITAYNSRTYNQFFEPTLSASSGYNSVLVNAGRVDNKGIEASLKFDDKFGQISWSSYAAFSLNRNKIVELLPAWTNPVTGEIISLTKMDMGGTGSYKMILMEGGSMSDIYVNTLKTDEHGAIYVQPSDQVVSADANNFVFAGSSTPKFNLSWGNNLRWKKISLGFLIAGRFGGIVVSNTQAIMDAFGVSQASADARDAGGALVNGKRVPAKAYYQTIGGGASGGVASMYCYSATNVRLSELTLGYDVPINKWCKYIKTFNVSFIARNLFMFYNKAPYDPEITANTGTYNQGVDYFMQPSLRNLGFSVKLQF